jgi:flagellar biosynthetic protein FliP
MLMVPPTIISLPFKILMFVLIDGWSLTVRALLGSFH